MNYQCKMLLAIIGFSIAALFLNCGEDPVSSAPPTYSDLIGKWTLTDSRTIATTTYHIAMLGLDSTYNASTDSTSKFTGNNDKAEFRSDSTYTLQSDEGFLTGSGMVQDSGNWSLSGNTLHLTSHAGQSVKDLSAGISGNSGTFSYAIIDSGVYLQTMAYKVTGTLEIFATKN